VVNAAKRQLRAQLRSARRALSEAQRRDESVATVDCCCAVLGDEVMASYVAMVDELDLGSLHDRRWSIGQAVFLPRVAGDGLLSWHAVTAASQLVAGTYGIREPDPTRLHAADLPVGTTILVPGVGFTRDGRRLGQGGGFYDRLLSCRPDLRSIGVGFASQLVADLPSEPHDCRLNGLIIAGEIVLPPSPT
jgi:5-formyltetrahydrofolate cyclo-ligase